MLRARLAGEKTASPCRTLWADEDAGRLGTALTDLASPLLFGGSDVLVIRHVQALAEADQERVLAALPGLGPKSHLLLVGGSVDMRRRLFAGCQRAGAAFAFPAVTDRRVARDWLGRFARERGHAIAPAASDEVIERVGTDLGLLDAEVEKLSLHAGPGAPIALAHVQAMVPATRAHGVEELTDRLARRDAAGAVHALRQLLDEGEPPVRVLAFLAANLRRALHVAELTEGGLSPADAAARLGLPAWLVEKSRGRGQAADLTRALHVLRHVDLALKRSRTADAHFEAAVLQIARS